MRASRISVIGAPLDLGAGRRGVDMGPSAMRVADLQQRLSGLSYIVEDCGNIQVVQAESREPGNPHARYLPEIAETCRQLANLVEKAAGAGKFPLILGGDHSAAVGTVSGMSRHFRKKKQKIGMIWVDAHADMNTPDPSRRSRARETRTATSRRSRSAADVTGPSASCRRPSASTRASSRAASARAA